MRYVCPDTGYCSQDDPRMTDRLPTLVATSVVRGSQHGESYGGVFTVDFEKHEIEQLFDLSESAIDFKGSSGDRGLRGIAFTDRDILVAERDATQTAVAAAALEVNLALVQVEELLNSLLVKINRKHAAVTLSLLTATHDRCCDKFW